MGRSASQVLAHIVEYFDSENQYKMPQNWAAWNFATATLVIEQA